MPFIRWKHNNVTQIGSFIIGAHLDTHAGIVHTLGDIFKFSSHNHSQSRLD